MTAIELRVRLDHATYGEVFRMLADAALPLPRPSTVAKRLTLPVRANGCSRKA